MLDAESPRCNAALDGGGLGVVVVGPREGLTSWLLFFLGLPELLDRADEFVLIGGLTGEDSRETRGELVADVGWL